MLVSDDTTVITTTKNISGGIVGMECKTVAILGGGNGAHAAAADLTRRGFVVRLYEEERFAKNMEKVFNTKEIEYSGVWGEGTAKISLVTSDLAEALKGAEIVILSVPAFAHKHYAKILPPYLEEGQVVLIFAGVFGSLVFWNELKKSGLNKDVVFAETYTLPYATRLVGPGKSLILTLTNPVVTGVMPAKRTAEVLPKLEPLYPVTAAKSVLDSGFYTLNPVIHVPGCVLNAGRIELMQGEFWFYKEGITPGVGRVTELLDAERMEIIKKLGYTPQGIIENLTAAGGKGTSVYEIVSTNAQWAQIKGPDGYKNRYFTEDIPFGLVGWAHIAHALGISTPIMDSLINLANGLMEQDCWQTGRQLEDMGLCGKNCEQILEYIQNG